MNHLQKLRSLNFSEKLLLSGIAINAKKVAEETLIPKKYLAVAIKEGLLEVCLCP